MRYQVKVTTYTYCLTRDLGLLTIYICGANRIMQGLYLWRKSYYAARIRGAAYCWSSGLKTTVKTERKWRNARL